MTQATVSAPAIDQNFPAGTVDPGFTYQVQGTLLDGSPYAQTQPNPSFDVPAGTFTALVSKLGYVSLESLPLTIDAPSQVTISIPDPDGQATLAVA